MTRNPIRLPRLTPFEIIDKEPRGGRQIAFVHTGNLDIAPLQEFLEHLRRDRTDGILHLL